MRWQLILCLVSVRNQYPTHSRRQRRQDRHSSVLPTFVRHPKIQDRDVDSHCHNRVLWYHILYGERSTDCKPLRLLTRPQLFIFQLDPISAAWTGLGRLRFDDYAVGIAQAALSMVLDIMVLTFPLPMIFQLHMPLRRKVFLALIFWLGIL